MQDPALHFYGWIIGASLRLFMVLPWLLAFAFLSRKLPSRTVCGLLLAGFFGALVAPLFPPLFQVRVPALAATGAFHPDPPVELQVASSPRAALAEGTSPLAEPTLPAVALNIWAAGAFLALLLRGWQYGLALARFADSAPVHPDHPGTLLLARLTREMRYRPLMFESPSALWPMAHGLFHPRILVSSQFLAQDAEIQEVVLCHEVEHLRQNDIMVRLALELLAVIFWFHPLVHMLLRSYDRAVEMACDDAVVARGIAASSLAEVLVGEAKRARMNRRQLREVRGRIKSILRRDKSRVAPTGSPRYVLSALFLLLLSPLALTELSPYLPYPHFKPLNPDPRMGGLWRFKMGRGDLVEDWSGFGRHGRISGATWINDPQRGTCLSFDGKDDILILPEVPSDWTQGPLTIAMWLKISPGSDGGGLLLRGDFNQTWCMAMAHIGNGVFRSFGERELSLNAKHGPHGGASILSPGRFLTYDSFGLASEQAPLELPEGEWLHVAFSLKPVLPSGREITFFVNGTASCSRIFLLGESSNLNFDWPTEYWYFGRGESPPVHGNHFEGMLSELAVFTVALSQDDIEKVMGGDYNFLSPVP